MKRGRSREERTGSCRRGGQKTYHFDKNSYLKGSQYFGQIFLLVSNERMTRPLCQQFQFHHLKAEIQELEMEKNTTPPIGFINLSAVIVEGKK